MVTSTVGLWIGYQPSLIAASTINDNGCDSDDCDIRKKTKKKQI